RRRQSGRSECRRTTSPRPPLFAEADAAPAGRAVPEGRIALSVAALRRRGASSAPYMARHRTWVWKCQVGVGSGASPGGTARVLTHTLRPPLTTFSMTLAPPGYCATIRFRSFNQECCLARQRQKVLIAADKQIRTTALSQVQERLIARVPARHCASFRHLDHLAVR